jgi:hypothetical protein
VNDAPEDVNNYGKVEISLHFRCIETDSVSEEQLAVAVDVSGTSFLMRSPRHLALGTLLSLRIRFPLEISGSPFRRVHSIGRVVSEHQFEDGALGYKVRIEKFDPNVSTALSR